MIIVLKYHPPNHAIHTKRIAAGKATRIRLSELLILLFF